MKKWPIILSSLLLVSCGAGYGHQSDSFKNIMKEELGGIYSPSYILYAENIYDSDLDQISEQFLPFIEGLDYQKIENYDDLSLTGYKNCLLDVNYTFNDNKSVTFDYQIYENDIVTLNIEDKSYYAVAYKGLYEQVVNGISNYIIEEK